MLAALLLAGPLALALRILLLLAGLVPAALLLAGALVLLLRHVGETPLLDRSTETTASGDFGCPAEPGSSQLRELDQPRPK